MLTDDDILRVIIDDRFERRVLGILRRRLQMDEKNAPLLENDFGMIPITLAAQKYGIPAAEIEAAIDNRHVKGDEEMVDETHLRTWRYGKDSNKGRNPLPAKETTKPGAPYVPLPQDEEEEEVPSCTLNEAAERLGLTAERVAELVLAGALVGVGADRVSLASIAKHRKVLDALSSRAEPGSHTPDNSVNGVHLATRTHVLVKGQSDATLNGLGMIATGNQMQSMDRHEVAKELNTTAATVGVMWKKWGLIRVSPGRYSRSSVLARKEFWAEHGRRSMMRSTADNSTNPTSTAKAGAISYAEACKAFNIPMSTLKNWLHVGHVPKASRGFVYPEDMRHYMETRGFLERVKG